MLGNHVQAPRDNMCPANNCLFAEQRLHSEQDLWEELVRQNQDNPDFKAIQPRKLSTEPGLNKFRWPNNQVLDNGQYSYKHDEFGNVIEKWTQPNEKGETEHHYLKYNGLQQLIRHAVRYQQTKNNNHQGYDRGRITTYLYDPTGRRMVKQTRVYENGYPVSVPQTTFYGWDGNRQVLIEQGDNHIHTIYEPNSFVPLVRIEGKKAEPVVSLARKIKEHYQVNIAPKSITVIEQIERELRTDKLTKQHQQMLREIGLSVEELRKLLDPEPTMEGKTIHHFINDHLGTPQFLINQDLQIDWYREQMPWGKTITEFNLKNLHQPIRMQGQHYDEESGLHYNRHRYYDPAIGRYLSPDPIGLAGGLNPYAYTENSPLLMVDPLGLDGGASGGIDVVAVVWRSSSLAGSVGHVYLADMNGNTLTSQFPDPSGLIGPNVTKNWDLTLYAEGRPPPLYIKFMCLTQINLMRKQKANEIKANGQHFRAINQLIALLLPIGH